MADITALILNDHEWFRRRFAELDDADGPERLAAIWEPLATRLDAHAEAEEAIFYPALLTAADADDETDDAIGDHNKIRDAVAAARQHEVGSDDWWAAVRDAREENDEHMGEEEHEGLADFRTHASDELRAELGQRWLDFYAEHPGGRGVEAHDKDPQQYVAENG